LIRRLLAILNKRENQLDFILDGIKVTKPKFFFTATFVDAVLENLYDALALSYAARDLRKLSITKEEIIVAINICFTVSGYIF